MLVRVVQFLLGAMLAAAGGYLAWDQKGLLASVFPPGQAGAPWLLLVGVFAICAGIVFLVSAVHPRPNRRKALAAKAEHEGKVLAEADTYYAEASRAADRDWRSGDLPAPAKPVPAAPKPALVDPPQAAPPPISPAPALVAAVPVTPAPAAAVAPAPAAPPQPDLAPPAQAEPAAAKPVASGVQPEPAAAAPPPVFPATATLQPIPQSAELPPVAATAPAPAPSPPAAAEVGEDPHAAITSAIREGRLEEAEQLLNARRESAEGIVLAQLTALAGDHAAAAGRQSHAKWLWRLAIKRFGEMNAMETAAAQRALENLRLAS